MATMMAGHVGGRWRPAHVARALAARAGLRRSPRNTFRMSPSWIPAQTAHPCRLGADPRRTRQRTVPWGTTAASACCPDDHPSSVRVNLFGGARSVPGEAPAGRPRRSDELFRAYVESGASGYAPHEPRPDHVHVASSLVIALKRAWRTCVTNRDTERLRRYGKR